MLQKRFRPFELKVIQKKNVFHDFIAFAKLIFACPSYRKASSLELIHKGSMWTEALPMNDFLHSQS